MLPNILFVCDGFFFFRCLKAHSKVLSKKYCLYASIEYLYSHQNKLAQKPNKIDDAPVGFGDNDIGAYQAMPDYKADIKLLTKTKYNSLFQKWILSIHSIHVVNNA